MDARHFSFGSARSRNAFIGNRREAKYGIFEIFRPFLHKNTFFEYADHEYDMEYLRKKYPTAILAHGTFQKRQRDFARATYKCTSEAHCIVPLHILFAYWPVVLAHLPQHG